MVKYTIALTLLIATLFSCNSVKKTMKEGNITNEYLVITIEGIDKLTKNPTLKIDTKESTVSGDAGCNRYGGSILIDGNKINFDRIRATKMYCLEHNRVETAFLKALSLTHHYTLKDKQILFFDKEDTLLFVGEQKVNK